MTLLELLVKELPKRGGWPHDVYRVTQDSDGQVNGYDSSTQTLHRETWAAQGFIDYLFDDKEMDLCEDWHTSIVTRDQYISALAASQQPVWDGEGLPPVGVECEARCCFLGSSWKRIILKWSNEKQFLYERVREGSPVHYSLAYVDQHSFRPIRTESERKREEVVAQIIKGANLAQDNVAEAIYDAIAAGKIPGVKLTDEG